jgi:hypothetical protein
MTRRLLAALAATLLVCTVAVTPDPLAKAALLPSPVQRAANPLSFDMRVGDGIIRVRIRTGEGGDTSLTIEIRVPGFFDGAVSPAALNSPR